MSAARSIAPRRLDRADFDRRLRAASERLAAAKAQRASVNKRLAQVRSRHQELQRRRVELREQVEARRATLHTPKSRAAAAILDAARTVMDVGIDELWLDYFALGGNATPDEVAGMLAGLKPILRLEHDRLVVAMNERFSEAGMGRPLCYWDGSR